MHTQSGFEPNSRRNRWLALMTVSAMLVAAAAGCQASPAEQQEVAPEALPTLPTRQTEPDRAPDERVDTAEFLRLQEIHDGSADSTTIDLDLAAALSGEGFSGTSGIAHRSRFSTDTLPGNDQPLQPSPGGQMAAATRDPLATEVGRAVLEDGGTAADAAVAIGVAISVSEPHFSHALGGGTWALYYNAAEDRVRALDGIGKTGSLVELDFFRDPERNRPRGPHRVIIPGAWDGWMLMLRDEGSMHLDELIQPAISMAEDGVPASRSMVGFIIQEQETIRSFSDTAAVFLPDGDPPRVGQTIRQPDLADTLRGLAAAYRRAHDAASPDPELSTADRDEYRRRTGIQAARDHYYRGPIAQRLGEWLLENGGFVTPEDFAAFEAQWLDPIFTHYRDVVVYASPPNSQGAAMLMALNILNHLDLSSGPDDPLSIHRIVEATKLGKIDTWHYVAEPDSMPVSIETLLEPGYARQRAARVSDTAAISWPEDGGLNLSEDNSTTGFVVMDAEGNTVSVTTSTGAQFLVGGSTGILLNQRMEVMEIAESNPNIIAPDKKPRHTVNQYMAFRDGQLLLAGGNTGFDTQPQGMIQQFLHIVEFGMSPHEAVSRRRFITHAFPASQHPHRASNELFLEPGTPGHIADDLRSRGHRIGRSGVIGNANLLYRSPVTGQVQYGADPRGENTGFVLPP
ncbi:gamma-glutamyltransferase family protein [Spirochaeta africana]|uniref:Gamma-glutamyltransferase n=1 Tax=Spirochaeta africana (strain ATCC 700263 / DSM 8902 / Z-7692) TaxID=889378 RepID=H9UHN8_SPIAZ|nr:gamma-glutamyltransferase [Spirochaeta africana]AFG37031.1 gamma-glutamyltransferase [Spirochaeta africana DSM 8902]